MHARRPSGSIHGSGGGPRALLARSAALGIAGAVLVGACSADWLRLRTDGASPDLVPTTTTTTAAVPPPSTTTTRPPAPPRPPRPEQAAEPRPVARPAPKPAPAAPGTFVAAGAGGPLTGGGPVAGLEGRPALVVKIDNAPKARPQFGLTDADVVFEEGVEGGISRFAAVFHSREAASVGPVRSARSTDIGIVSALSRPLFAYSGANDVFKERVRQAPLVDVGVENHPDRYRREETRPSPNNLFSATGMLFSLAPPEAKAPPVLFAYRRPDERATGAGARPVGAAEMRWRDSEKGTKVAYQWDGEVRAWRRSQDGSRHTDPAGSQVAPRNVVVQFVSYRDSGFVDSTGASVPEAEVVGEGDAWVLTGGSMVPARWSKPSPEAVTRFVDAAGAEVRLAPGATWVELIPPGFASFTERPADPEPPPGGEPAPPPPGDSPGTPPGDGSEPPPSSPEPPTPQPPEPDPQPPAPPPPGEPSPPTPPVPPSPPVPPVPSGAPLLAVAALGAVRWPRVARIWSRVARIWSRAVAKDRRWVPTGSAK